MKRAYSEALGTALLLAIIVGSGIMGERLAKGNDAIALLANSLATGFGLAALIIAFGPRSGAHFNPLVTLALFLKKEFPGRDVMPYIVAQFAGAIAGMLMAHAMFDLEILRQGVAAREGEGQWFSEIVATFGLVFIVLSLDPKRTWAAPAAVGGYIAAAYWFTASTSFANPAVALARGFTDTFSGIRPDDIAGFVVAQAAGAALALAADWYLREKEA